MKAYVLRCFLLIIISYLNIEKFILFASSDINRFSYSKSETSSNFSTNHVYRRKNPNNYYEFDYLGIAELFPKYIPNYPIRKDVYTNQPVERGRLELLGHLYDSKNKVTFDEFRKLLQCPISEPGIYGRRGSLHLSELLKPTKSMLESVCAWAESHELDCETWHLCYKQLLHFKNLNAASEELNYFVGTPYRLKLMRIINGTLYIDWPWKRYRFKVEDVHPYHTRLIQFILNKVSDIEDSAFFLAEEWSVLPFNFNIPTLSNSPSLRNSDLPYPWPRAVSEEILLYEKAEWSKGNLTFSQHVYDIHHSNEKNIWENRINKAGFYGSISQVRNILFDIARLNPDYIDAYFSNGLNELTAWNPLSNETYVFKEHVTQKLNDFESNKYLNSVGYIQHILPLFVEEGKLYLEMEYKYLIVMIGLSGRAAADRLAEVLAHSGAVCLLQEHDFDYHFSIRLKPWVHYVPISYNTADVIYKIKWLNSHPKLAMRIANNAKTFGQSYLRLEDYFCYTAALLKSIARVESNSDVLEPFDPIQVRKDVKID